MFADCHVGADEKFIILSALPSVLSSDKVRRKLKRFLISIAVGTKFEDTKIVRIDPGLGVVLSLDSSEGNEQFAQVHISRLSDERLPRLARRIVLIVSMPAGSLITIRLRLLPLLRWLNPHWNNNSCLLKVFQLAVLSVVKWLPLPGTGYPCGLSEGSVRCVPLTNWPRLNLRMPWNRTVWVRNSSSESCLLMRLLVV